MFLIFFMRSFQFHFIFIDIFVLFSLMQLAAIQRWGTLRKRQCTQPEKKNIVSGLCLGSWIYVSISDSDSGNGIWKQIRISAIIVIRLLLLFGVCVGELH